MFPDNFNAMIQNDMWNWFWHGFLSIISQPIFIGMLCAPIAWCVVKALVGRFVRDMAYVSVAHTKKQSVKLKRHTQL